MKYYLYHQESNINLRYPYWVLVANEPLIKFDIWSVRKSFNCTLYNELQVLEMIDQLYPNSIRIPRPKLRGRNPFS